MPPLSLSTSLVPAGNTVQAELGFAKTAHAAPWFFSDQDALEFVEHKGFTDLEEEILTGHSGALTRSGMFVGAEAALRISTAYACRRVIAEDIAKMPRRVVRVTRLASGAQEVSLESNHPVHRLLNEAPNDWMTPFEFIEYLVGVATFHHGSYALIQRNGRGEIEELLPVLPGCGGPETDTDWTVRYRISGYGQTFLREAHTVLRLHGPMADPWAGMATVTLAREAIGLAAAIEAAQSRFHANDLRPSGTLTTEMTVDDKQRTAIRDSWKQAYGPGGQGGVAVLDKSFKFEPITMEGAKSEVVENRKFQVSDTCRFFRVFPLAIGHNDGSQSFASVEAFFTAHKEHTLHPWVKRVEEAMTLCLLSPEERRAGLKVDIDMDALMRGTLSDRVRAYKDAVSFFMTPNEVREREGLERIDDPNMDRVQLPANNTGLLPASAGSGDPRLRGEAAGIEPVPGAPPATQPVGGLL